MDLKLVFILSMTSNDLLSATTWWEFTAGLYGFSAAELMLAVTDTVSSTHSHRIICTVCSGRQSVTSFAVPWSSSEGGGAVTAVDVLPLYDL